MSAAVRTITLEHAIHPLTLAPTFMMYFGDSKKFASFFSTRENAVLCIGNELLRGNADTFVEVFLPLPEPVAPDFSLPTFARHEHDCESCKYLGHHGNADLYVCLSRTFATLIARTGPEGQYKSVEVSDFLAAGSSSEAIRRAYAMAVEDGWLPSPN